MGGHIISAYLMCTKGSVGCISMAHIGQFRLLNRCFTIQFLQTEMKKRYNQDINYSWASNNSTELCWAYCVKIISVCSHEIVLRLKIISQYYY